LAAGGQNQAETRIVVAGGNEIKTFLASSLTARINKLGCSFLKPFFLFIFCEKSWKYFYANDGVAYLVLGSFNQ
jgi:hypothetical protein